MGTEDPQVNALSPISRTLPAKPLTARFPHSFNARVLTASVTSSAPVAVVLAAGLGTRLQSLQSERPKGFVEIGGEPIIARSVRLLRAAGVRDFVFVTGWKAEAYRDWGECEVPGFRSVMNPHFASTGSLRSFALGAATVPGRDLLIVESDLLYERRAPELLLSAASPDVVLVSGATRSGDEVWVHAREGDALASMGKQRVADREPYGELVGLTRVSAALAQQLIRAAEELSPAAHYEDGLNLAAVRQRIALLRVAELAWCEIDDPAHLARARATVWPRIQAIDGQLAVTG